MKCKGAKEIRENSRVIFIEVDLMCYNYKNNARKRGGDN
jgi:hypothetical protein